MNVYLLHVVLFFVIIFTLFISMLIFVVITSIVCLLLLVNTTCCFGEVIREPFIHVCSIYAMQCDIVTLNFINPSEAYIHSIFDEN